MTTNKKESRIDETDKAHEFVSIHRTLRGVEGTALVRDDAVLVTAFIPSQSSAREPPTIPDEERKRWMEILMAVFGKRFIGSTCIGGDHYGLYVPPKKEEPPAVELPRIVQSYAAMSEITEKPGVLKELGDMMFGMANELNQWETMLTIDVHRFRFLNPDFDWDEPDRIKYGLPKSLTMDKVLRERGRTDSVRDWPFIKEAWTDEVRNRFVEAYSEVKARKANEASVEGTSS